MTRRFLATFLEDYAAPLELTFEAGDRDWVVTILEREFEVEDNEGKVTRDMYNGACVVCLCVCVYSCVRVCGVCVCVWLRTRAQICLTGVASALALSESGHTLPEYIVLLFLQFRNRVPWLILDPGSSPEC